MIAALMECCVEFKALLADPSEAWQAGWGDEELNYKLERCIYVFFMSGLSVLESFAFCLYFLGNAIRPRDFPQFDKPKKITLTATSRAFTAAFPNAVITRRLVEMATKARVHYHRHTPEHPGASAFGQAKRPDMWHDAS
jgi:hypothetical protein